MGTCFCLDYELDLLTSFKPLLPYQPLHGVYLSTQPTLAVLTPYPAFSLITILHRQPDSILET
jgi:hypothetical protein